MKTIKTILLAGVILTSQSFYSNVREIKVESRHAHDVNFSVIVKHGEQLLSGANVRVFINSKEVAKGVTNEQGKVDLLVKDYKHETIKMVTSHPDFSMSTKQMTLTAGKFYYVGLSGPVETSVEMSPALKKEIEEAKEKAAREKAQKEAEERAAQKKAEEQAKKEEMKRLEDAEKEAKVKAKEQAKKQKKKLK